MSSKIQTTNNVFLAYSGGPVCGLEPDRIEPRSANVGAASGGQGETNRSPRQLKGGLVVGFAGLLLAVTITAVYMTRLLQPGIPAEIQTTPYLCFVTAWEQMRHPGQFDDLCRN
jgi:hypothetical protein